MVLNLKNYASNKKKQSSANGQRDIKGYFFKTGIKHLFLPLNCLYLTRKSREKY